MFDRGGSWDRQEACTTPPTAGVVAAWTSRLAELHGELSDAERIDVIRALEELKSGAAAAQARLTASLDASRRAERAAAGVPAAEQGHGVASEIALARRVSPTRGSQHLGLAKALVHEMPHTHAALTQGLLTEWRATILVRQSACLTVEDRALFDEQIAADPALFTGWGDQRLTNEAKKVAYRLDAESVVRRARKAETQRCVTVRPAPDTMTYLTGLLPVTQGVAVYAALSREADSCRAQGDQRSRGQIMADTLVERVTGQTTASDVRVEVQVVMADTALFSGGDEPAQVTGCGTVPAAWARDLVSRALTTTTPTPAPPGAHPAPPGANPAPPGPAPTPPGAHPVPPGRDPAAAGGTGIPGHGSDGTDVWIRRLYCDPTGRQLVAMDSRARRAPAGLARFITARDQSCRTPWCDAAIRHIDHITARADGGPTDEANLQGLCEACNYTKQAPGWSARAVPATDDPLRQRIGRTRNAQSRRRKRHRATSSKAASPKGRRYRFAREWHEVITTTPTGHSYRSSAPPPVGSPPGRTSPAIPTGAAATERGQLSALEEFMARMLDSAA